MRTILFILTMLAVVSIATAAETATPQADPLPFGELTLTLRSAVLRQLKDKSAEPRDLMVGLVPNDGQWETNVQAISPDLSRSHHDGRLISQKITPDQVTLGLEMRINAEWWMVPGGPGRYTVTLRRTDQGLQGQFTGTYKNIAVSGAASAAFNRPAPTTRPIAPGEHPRLAFRQADIAALQAAAKTPQGQAVIQRLTQLLDNWTEDQPAASFAAGHALLAIINQQPQQAEISAALVRYALDHQMTSERWPTIADSAIGIALAYDLCYQQWDPLFRSAIARELSHRSRELVGYGEPDNGYVVDTSSAYQAAARGAAGVCGMAVLGDPLRNLEDIEEPVLKIAQSPTGFKPGKGVPVTTLETGFMPPAWIYAGPFPRQQQPSFQPGHTHVESDPLASIGGRAQANPAVGTQVASEQLVRTFQPLPPQFVLPNDDKYHHIELTAATGHTPQSVWYFYTVLDNPEIRYVRPMFDSAVSSMWVGGQRAENDTPIKILPGKIPLMFEARIGKLLQWNTTRAEPRFNFVDEANASGHIRYLRDERQRGTATSDGVLRHNLRLSRLCIERFLETAAPPADNSDAAALNLAGGLSQGALPFLLAYRNVGGIDLVPTQANWVTWLAHGGQGVPAGVPSQRPELFAMGGFALSDAVRPAAATAFHRTWGAAGDRTFALRHPHESIYLLVGLCR